MQDVEIIGMLKSYVAATLVGMGALKGAACQVQGAVDNGDGTQTLTFVYEDNDGESHTYDVELPSAMFDFTDLQDGDTLKYDATSGKFENSAIAFSCDLGDLDDVTFTDLQNGQTIKWDSTNSRWVNISLGSAAEKNAVTTISEDGTNVPTDGAVYSGLAEKVDKETGKGLSENDFTDALKTKLDGIEDSADVNTIETVKVNGTALVPDGDKAVDVEAVESISVNGVAQTVTAGATDLDVASNLITEAQWTSITALLS